MSKEKLSEEKIQEALRGIKTGNVEIKPASQDDIIMLRPYVMKVLDAVGHPEAWVSDFSSISDFSPADKKESVEFIARVSVKIGFFVKDKDYIVDLAMRLKALDLAA